MRRHESLPQFVERAKVAPPEKTHRARKRSRVSERVSPEPGATSRSRTPISSRTRRFRPAAAAREGPDKTDYWLTFLPNRNNEAQPPGPAAPSAYSDRYDADRPATACWF